MERIKWIIKRFLVPPAVILLAILASTLTGCAYTQVQYAEEDKLIRDPSYLAVAYVNGQYHAKVYGAFGGTAGTWFKPNEVKYGYVGCPSNSHFIIVEAFRETAKSASGKYSEKTPIGWRKIPFSVRVQDKREFGDRTISQVVYIGSSFYSPSRIVDVGVYAPCSLFIPTITLEHYNFNQPRR